MLTCPLESILEGAEGLQAASRLIEHSEGVSELRVHIHSEKYALSLREEALRQLCNEFGEVAYFSLLLVLSLQYDDFLGFQITVARMVTHVR